MDLNWTPCFHCAVHSLVRNKVHHLFAVIQFYGMKIWEDMTILNMNAFWL